MASSFGESTLLSFISTCIEFNLTKDLTPHTLRIVFTNFCEKNLSIKLKEHNFVRKYLSRSGIFLQTRRMRLSRAFSQTDQLNFENFLILVHFRTLLVHNFIIFFIFYIIESISLASERLTYICWEGYKRKHEETQ